MTERELFEGNIHPRILSWVYFCNDSNGYKFKIVTCDTDKYRALSELNFGWEMWQASASREGYKLVPIDSLKIVLDCISEDNLHFVSGAMKALEEVETALLE